MPFINKSPLNYPVNTYDSIRIFEQARAPTNADYKNFKVGDEWWETGSNDFWKMVYKDGTSGLWRKMAGTAASVEFFTPDTGGQTGPDALNNINCLGNTGAYLNGSLFIGDPANNTLSVRDLRNITKYVVDPTADETEYTTIQSAIDAAQAAGVAATVWVRQGTYNENLTLYDNIDIFAACGVADTGVCILNGTHIPPATGSITIRNMYLQSDTDVFLSAVAGTSTLILIDCAIAVTNGYTFNLPNWIGLLVGFDIGEVASTNDGWINNTGGASVFMTNVTIGRGAGNSMIISGSSEFYNCVIRCPVTFGAGTDGFAGGGCVFQGTLTFTGTGYLDIFNSTFNTGATEAINTTSANQVSLSNVTIDSSANPCIIGTGLIQFGSITYLDSPTVAGTIVKDFITRLETGELKIDDADDGVLYALTGVVDSVGAMTDGEIAIGSTGVAPVAATITAGAGIAVTNAAGSITVTNSVYLTSSVDVAADGTYYLAMSNNLHGRFALKWANGGNRDHEMELDININQFDSAGCITITANRAYLDQQVISNVRLVNDAAGSHRWLTVDVGNRNGTTGPLYISYFGNIPVTLAPAAPGAPASTPTFGMQQNYRAGYTYYSDVSAGTILENMTNLGEHTMPLQPAFLATHTVDQLNITGNGTVAGINFTTEVYDQNSDYDGTNTFTAPVTGKYLLTANVIMSDMAAITTADIRIATTARTYRGSRLGVGAVSAGTVSLELTTIADMTATDTVVVAVLANGIGADTADAGNEPQFTYFTGVLIC